MNTTSTTTINVFHDEGLLFVKLEDKETGISYVQVPPEEYDPSDMTGLLVRHGNHETNQCGYYPLYLLFKTRHYRERVAVRHGKRPPSDLWIKSMIVKLKDAGYAVEARIIA